MAYERRGPLRLDRFQLETFGERLQLALRKRGMTETQLSRMLHSDAKYMSMYVRDERVPTLGNALAMADALDVSLDWLLGRKPRDREAIYRE